MRTTLFLMCLALLEGSALSSQEIVTNSAGEKISLSADGSWQKISTSPESSKDKLDILNGIFTIRYNSMKWVLEKNSAGVIVTLNHNSGSAYAEIIAIKDTSTPKILKKATISYINKKFDNAIIISDEIINVNNKDVLAIKFSGELIDIKFIHCLYLYTGKEGTIRVDTWAGESLYDDVASDCLEFLNGLAVKQ